MDHVPTWQKRLVEYHTIQGVHRGRCPDPHNHTKFGHWTRTNWRNDEPRGTQKKKGGKFERVIREESQDHPSLFPIRFFFFYRNIWTFHFSDALWLPNLSMIQRLFYHLWICSILIRSDIFQSTVKSRSWLVDAHAPQFQFHFLYWQSETLRVPERVFTPSDSRYKTEN